MPAGTLNEPPMFRLRRLMLKSLPLAATTPIPLIAHALPGESASTYGGHVAMVLPIPPGGSGDVVARQLQPGLKQALGQPVVVDHRPGAAGLQAAATVARARPDGQTLLMAFDSLALQPIAYKQLPYDTFRDFTPISQLARHPLVVAVHPSLPVDNIRGLIGLARQRDEPIRVASPGAGSLNQLAAQALASEGGASWRHVAFKGTGPAVQAVLSDQADLVLASYAAVQAHLQTRTLKALAVTGERRLAQLPQVPTVAEQGVPGFEAYGWIGVFGPAGLPAAVVGRLHGALSNAIRAPRVASTLAAHGLEPVAGTPEALGQLVRREHDRWQAVARQANLQFE
ncbi:tripartite tricarboxylate transporter substrate binding protein [Cupriavidus gilardii]|nr:tripartite tricarboxylate transporter substrate binding protein [Cupriavidus gilardii]NSX02344.1 tripartite tricarboxylate transporter substrate binding protein [Cupriavidus gilardii]